MGLFSRITSKWLEPEYYISMSWVFQRDTTTIVVFFGQKAYIDQLHAMLKAWVFLLLEPIVMDASAEKVREYNKYPQALVNTAKSLQAELRNDPDFHKRVEGSFVDLMDNTKQFDVRLFNLDAGEDVASFFKFVDDAMRSPRITAAELVARFQRQSTP